MTPTIASRIDRLPLCGFHHRFITLVSIGTWFDFFDLFMTSYLGAALQDSHFLTLAQFSELIAAGFLGMFIGTIVQGTASDYLGRRRGFIVTLLLYSVVSIIAAFSPSAGMLIVMRFFAGIGLSGQQVVADTYISEMVPGRSRGRYVAFSQLVGFTAVPVVAFLSRILVPTHWLMDGWRWVMIIGGAGTVFAWVIMHWIKESPRWLESRGRTDEAERITREIESEVERDTGRPLPAPEPIPIEAVHRAPIRELFGPAYRGRMIMLIVFNLLQTVGFYGFTNWAPTYILREGNNLGQALQYTFVIALVNPIGPFLGVITTELLERKRILVTLSLLIAFTGMAFAFSRRPIAIIMIGMLLTILNTWFSSVYHAYQAELFPTRARATGVGIAYGFSRLGALCSTFIIAALLLHGVFTVFAFIAAAMLGVAMVVGIWGPRTNAIPLEELSS
jgi:putative MFS transporter